MQVQIDSRDGTIYTGYQFGNYFRISGDKRKYITPKHELGKRPYRWNWQSPILLSKHNEDIIYFGSNKLLRSMDKGETFREISKDLTNGGKSGDVPFGTISTVDESIHQFGLLYVGTDDGHIHRSDDGGNSWEVISYTLPSDKWVSRVIASEHQKDRVYVVLNGYRTDDFAPYLYISEDRGNTWKNLSGGLPFKPLNVVKEDPQSDRIIYVGGDHGLYISVDTGASFMTLGDFPVVPVHDVFVHPRESDLIIATHGRSINKMDVEYLQQLVSEDKINENLVLFDFDEARFSSKYGSQAASYRDPIEPDYSVFIYARGSGKATMEIIAGDDVVVKSKEIELKKGIQVLNYHLDIDKAN
jgi:hypothetical protein